MPQGDRTGPSGQGSMTGRGMGFCAGFNAPGFMNSGFGRGFGKGRGFGWRARPIQSMPIQEVQPAVITEKQEKQFLEQELNFLKEEMEKIEKKLKELKN
ncbi:MAG: DUF5320 domain-containing protein [Nanoarchaeota archaeon]|nr:DUF5320 domain-containing protein [Nanoarchaeota archaeon]MBU1028413.1 DUF5320 domain-containing protein [Nanoarchaeota archaeon]